MQERQVTISSYTFPLSEPFLVLATQNPIEHEGTYQLPEAQLDRFMLKVKVGYPNRKEELEIINRIAEGPKPVAGQVVGADEILLARQLANKIYVDDKIKRYIIDIVFATRAPREYGLDLSGLISFGASPRASIFLTLCAKAYAFLQKRGYVIPEDVKGIAMDIMRHRVAVTYEAEAESITSEDIVRQVLEKVKVP
jgi:MoxR-like ATPase